MALEQLVLRRGAALLVLAAAVALGVSRAGDTPSCTLYFEGMETGATGWSSFVPAQAKIGDPPGPSTWHLDDEACFGQALGGTWFVSNGNAGPGCVADSAREHSVLVGPELTLPEFGSIVLDFDARSLDESGSCFSSASFDKHDVGVSLDDGTTWTRLNDCTPLTDGTGQTVHHTFDLAAWAGQTIRLVFAYDTRDDSSGHTFAVDNILVSATSCQESCGDGIVDDGEACDDANG